MAERQFGPYRLVRQIAVGGMAEIHLAKTKGIAGFEKYVALKMIHPNFAEDEQFIQMLVDEAKIAVQLTHGNIAQTFDLGRVGDTYYITMEYVDGADLYKILRRASERDLELPLDVCAFIGKEIASALDHAHRKRDHAGKPLGIVHRDVSPQNVLISYSGEVKLVDFGIAKATMKARQTAVGVIKGKYYYMSPEQAWGDNIDYRSDIFSAGIVLYEMITGQMLYLEEDLHKLLDMARKAQIAPPSKLRKGVPPQLERIVMHALEKVPGERYQSAGDFATDLERFLHTYSPVFTAGKIATIIRQILGDPSPVPDDPGFPSIEVRDGVSSTHPLDISELVREADEIRDENSVIFRVDELQPPSPPPPPPSAPAPRVPSRPRQAHEETRELDYPAPPGLHDDGPEPDLDELEHIGERTVISAPSGMGSFMMDAGDDGVDATIVTSGPPVPSAEVDDGQETIDRAYADEGPTVTRDPVVRPTRALRGKAQPAPPAFAAKIHAPAVSELKKPKASRRTPPGGVPAQQPNVLQQLVGAQVSEPMPAPRQAVAPARPPVPAEAPSPPSAPSLPAPPQFPSATPGGQVPYAADASGLPLAMPTPPGLPAAQPPQGQPYPPPQGQPYPGYPPHGYAPQAYPGYPVQAQGYPGQAGQVSPQGLYQFQPYGQPPPQKMTLTGQLRLFEADELPSQYKLDAARRRWVTYIAAILVAVSVAASTTFFIIRATRSTDAPMGRIHIESVPPGAEVIYDGNRLTEKTPFTIDHIAVGTRHEIRVELPHHKTHAETVDIPKQGGQISVMALLKPITGKLVVNSVPGGAEIRINDQLRGRTPTTLTDIDMKSARRIELRLAGYEPYVQELVWPKTGQIDLDVKLQR